MDGDLRDIFLLTAFWTKTEPQSQRQVWIHLHLNPTETNLFVLSLSLERSLKAPKQLHTTRRHWHKPAWAAQLNTDSKQSGLGCDYNYGNTRHTAASSPLDHICQVMTINSTEPDTTTKRQRRHMQRRSLVSRQPRSFVWYKIPNHADSLLSLLLLCFLCVVTSVWYLLFPLPAVSPFCATLKVLFPFSV